MPLDRRCRLPKSAVGGNPPFLPKTKEHDVGVIEAADAPEGEFVCFGKDGIPEDDSDVDSPEGAKEDVSGAEAASSVASPGNREYRARASRGGR